MTHHNVRTFDTLRPAHITREALTKALIDHAGWLEEDFEDRTLDDIWGHLDDRDRRLFIDYLSK